MEATVYLVVLPKIRLSLCGRGIGIALVTKDKTSCRCCFTRGNLMTEIMKPNTS